MQKKQESLTPDSDTREIRKRESKNRRTALNEYFISSNIMNTPELSVRNRRACPLHYSDIL